MDFFIAVQKVEVKRLAFASALDIMEGVVEKQV